MGQVFVDIFRILVYNYTRIQKMGGILYMPGNKLRR